MSYKEFLNNKRVSVVGLGPHGEMLADIKFLIKNKAKVSLFDMRSEDRFKKLTIDIRELGLNKISFGKVDETELLESDLIIISSEISKKSLFLKKAIQAEIQIEFPETLFFKLSPPITLIGVLGQYGKSTVTQMVHTILKKSFSEYKDQGLFVIDPESSNGILSNLRKIKKDDVVLARIPELMIPLYHSIRISPHVAVVTSITNFDILEFQTYNNFIVAPDGVVDALRLERKFAFKAKILRTRANMIPLDWHLNLKNIHDKENLALVLQTCELFKVSSETVREISQEFVSPKGSVEFIKKVGGIEYYNDANSITPHSTLSAIKSLSVNRNIVLILGGAYTGHDYVEMVKNIPQYVHTIILLPGSGTLGIRMMLDELADVKIIQSISLEDAVIESTRHTNKTDRVLFSPAFEAVGVDISRKERGEKFVKAVRSL